MDISVLIPIRDEELNLPEFHQIAANSLSTNKSVIGRLEFIYINDCSEDKSLEVLHDLAKTDTRIKIIDFSKQYGKTAALDAGFKQAQYPYVVTIDADLQYHPKDILRLAAEMNLSNTDAVFGRRVKRTTGVSRKFSSFLATSFRNFVLNFSFSDCYFAIYKKKCASSMKLYRGFQDFLPLLLKLEGYTFSEIPVEEYPRKHGVSKYGFWNRVFKGFFALLVVRWLKNNHLGYEIKTAHD